MSWHPKEAIVYQPAIQDIFLRNTYGQNVQSYLGPVVQSFLSPKIMNIRNKLERLSLSSLSSLVHW